MRALEARAPRARAALRRQAPVRAAQGDEHVQGRRGRRVRRRRAARASSKRCGCRRAPFTELGVRQGGHALAARRGRARRRARRRAALRGVGGAHAGGQGRAQAAACCSARRASSTTCSSCRSSRRTLNGVDALAARRRRTAAPARRLRADRSRHGSRRRARPGALLHLVPRAGQGFVLARAAREEAGATAAPATSVQEDRRSA